ncbi:NERD domain-containing protein [Lentisphaera profundi]|uniref:NERD domain-containing protein n=1 Tax=Lentisphaera profundi TaxID=1658616 RepID=A0ABY7VQ95_9BACT|nr:NERD domain-containing protein [Lentisphaera profundi]WDE96365.1 NERD domain-containing protein [Lentisphaera profundi]
MPQFIRLRPEYKCHESEQKVATLLQRLPSHWIVVWGYYYKGPRGVSREGDFLVFNPDAGVLVIEAKGGVLRRNKKTGEWNTHGRTAPDSQLFREIQGVRDILARAGGSYKMVVKGVLACPDLCIQGKVNEYQGLPRELIMDRDDLESFVPQMDAKLGRIMKIGAGEAEKMFRKAFVSEDESGVDPKSVKETDKYLTKLINSKVTRVLNHLIHNRQFVVKGAPGSGKSWMALGLARIWAGRRRERGGSVLILCYNRALRNKLKDIADKMEQGGQARKGTITVRLWEDLARDIYKQNGLEFVVPDEQAARNQFYESQLPLTLEGLVAAGKVTAEYDCLIVDEAQDHDTEFPIHGTNGPGWWSIYFSLLKEGAAARIAVLYDSDQRPSFRRGGMNGFDAEKLYSVLESNPIRLNLFESYRYTMNIFKYLIKIKSNSSKIRTMDLTPAEDLPAGEPVVEKVLKHHLIPKYLDDTIKDLLKRKVCQPEEIMIIANSFSKNRRLLPSGTMGGAKINNGLFPEKNKILYISANKVKGLETKVAFLVGYDADFQQDEQQCQSLFIGASRARQILYVVFTK